MAVSFELWQPLQRRSSGTQAAAESRSVSNHAQIIVQQSSTRFIPAALVSSKPAPRPRPASAAPPQRKYAASTRPSTAGPSRVTLAAMTAATAAHNLPSTSYYNGVPPLQLIWQEYNTADGMTGWND
ncbi:hypothetical protein ABBQ38_007218 [Trebouxia sp. C0009 RCD-2024]